MLIFKKQSNIDSLKIPSHFSSKWKAIYRVECYVIFFILIVYYYSQVFLGIKISCVQWKHKIGYVGCNRRHWTVTKRNGMWIWIQLLFK